MVKDVDVIWNLVFPWQIMCLAWSKSVYSVVQLVQCIPIVSHDDCATTIHVLKTMRFYYCNFLLAKHPAVHLFCLQSLQYAATHLFTAPGHWDHITLSLLIVHWLLMKCQIDLELFILVFTPLVAIFVTYSVTLIWTGNYILTPLAL